MNPPAIIGTLGHSNLNARLYHEYGVCRESGWDLGIARMPFTSAFWVSDCKARLKPTSKMSGPSFSPQITVFEGSLRVPKGLLHTRISLFPHNHTGKLSFLLSFLLQVRKEVSLQDGVAAKWHSWASDGPSDVRLCHASPLFSRPLLWNRCMVPKEGRPGMEVRRREGSVLI